MQTEIPVMSEKSNLKVELFQYGGLLFHAAGTGFVQYYILLTFSRKTANINVKNSGFIATCKAIIDTYKTAKIPSVTSGAVDIIKTVYYIHGP